MGTQDRIRFQRADSGGGGGGGPPASTAFLEVGPDYGEGAGNDDETWFTGYANDGVEEVALTAFPDTGIAHDLTDVDFDGASEVGVAHDLSDVDFLAEQHEVGQQCGNNIFDQDTANAATVQYMHFAKSEYLSDLDSNDQNAFVLLDEDSPDTERRGRAQRDNDNYVFLNAHDGTIPAGIYYIQPETVAGVTNDERRAYFKFPTKELSTTGNGDLWDLGSGEVDGFSILFSVWLENPAAATDATITISFHSQGGNPWDDDFVSFNDVGGFYSLNTAFHTDTDVIGASSSGLVTVSSSSIEANVLNNDWIIVQVQSDLTNALGPVEVHPFHASGQPNDYPGDFRAGAIAFNIHIAP